MRYGGGSIQYSRKQKRRSYFLVCKGVKKEIEREALEKEKIKTVQQ
jgi:hypothetical protein